MTPDELDKLRTRFLLLRDQLGEIASQALNDKVGTEEQWHCVWELIGAMKVDLGLDPIATKERLDRLEPAEGG